MHGGAWRARVHGVAKSRTQLSDFTFPFTSSEPELYSEELLSSETLVPLSLRQSGDASA